MGSLQMSLTVPENLSDTISSGSSCQRTCFVVGAVADVRLDGRGLGGRNLSGRAPGEDLQWWPHQLSHFLAPCAQVTWRSLWLFVRGGKLRNLEELWQSLMPQEPASWQLWKLMSLGFSRPQPVPTVKLLGDTSWSNLPAEQQHGTLEKLHRYHSTKTLTHPSMQDQQ